MSMTWTEEQEQVIFTRGRNLLVSAAAGSGKTAVLVERILTMITDPEKPVDIDRLLVVTFTRAAAGEMRERISAAIEERLLGDPEDEHLQRQSVLLHNACISTIDGFCTYVIRNYFYRTDLDPGYRVAEEGELKQLAGDVMQELLEEEYTAAKPSFLSLGEVLSPGKDDRKLEEVIRQVYDFSMANPDPSGWLADCVAAGEADTEDALLAKPWMRESAAEAQRITEGLLRLAEENLRMASRADGPEKYLPMAQSDLEILETLQACATYRDWHDALDGLKFRTLAVYRNLPEELDPELQERFKANRDVIRKQIQELQKGIFSAGTDEILRQLAVIRPYLAELTRLAELFGQRYAEKKRARNLVDFTDLEHYALHILLEQTGSGWVRTEEAKELAGRFTEIMIDEYQDSNLLQEYLLGAVSGTEEGIYNRFMVGDMKQSIYGFRMARPELFLEKYETYQLIAPGSPDEVRRQDGLATGAACQGRITLGKNFRSRPEVLDFVNAVCKKLMCADLGGIDYDDEAALYQGASFEEVPEGNTAELLLLDKKAPEFEDDRSRETMLEAEAMLVAMRIRELKRSGQVCDRHTGALRPVQYRDIVILLRAASGAAATYARVLQSVGIPAYAASRKGYFSATEVVAVLNYLRILDNPRQEIPFAAILRSPMCGCTDEELARIHSAFPESPIYEAARLYAAGAETVRDMPETEKAWDMPETKTARDMPETEGAEMPALAEDETRPPLKDAGLREKLSRFLGVFDALRAELCHTPVHEVVQAVLERTGYGAFASSMPAGEQRAANLRMLVETAAAYEKTSYHGLFRFVRYIEQLGSYNVDYGEVNLFGEGEDTVRVMTIHKSKGLEFPVVFLCGTGTQFNMRDLNDTVIRNARFGIGMDAVDLSTRVKTPSLLRRMIRNVNRRDLLGEELRVLYVALTRAREKLIITGVAGDLEKRGIDQLVRQKDAGEPVSYVRRNAGKCYLDWILDALTADTPVQVHVVRPSELGATELASADESAEWITRLRFLAEHPSGGSGEVRELLQAKDAFQYPYAERAELPAKLSVSEIKKRSIEEQMEEKGISLFREEPVIPLVPRFIREAEPAGEKAESSEEQVFYQGAARGTIYHQVLAALDLPALAGIRQISDEAAAVAVADILEMLRIQVDEMVADGRLSGAEANAVELNDLAKFVCSPIARRMSAAAARGALVREQPFVIDIPAREIAASYLAEEPILVQGVIDAYFEEDGKYVIVDYKTDRVFRRDGRDLADKYRVQLQYYRHALEQILNVQVKELYLYSFALGREIRVR